MPYMQLEHWGDKVARLTDEHGPLVLGIDPVKEDIPMVFGNESNSPAETLRSYISFLLTETTGVVGFLKFQSAFFEAYGSQGISILSEAIRNARERGFGIILDAKRGDIGSTSAAYAQAYLTPQKENGSDLEVDCMTINPFLGLETMDPFLMCAKKYGKGLFILVKTSNPDSGWLQEQTVKNGLSVSDVVATLVSQRATETLGTRGLSTIGAVVGMTYPKDGERLRDLMPTSVFLIPGFGAQGGALAGVRAMERKDSGGVLVPVSRGITKAPRMDLSLEEYRVFITNRIQSIKTELEHD